MDDDAMDAGPTEPCARPLGTYRTSPSAYSSSNSSLRCFTPEPTSVEWEPYEESQTFGVGLDQCTQHADEWEDRGCSLFQLLECEDGSSVSQRCSLSEDGAQLHCRVENDLLSTVCSGWVDFERVDCEPPLVLEDDNVCHEPCALGSRWQADGSCSAPLQPESLDGRQCVVATPEDPVRSEHCAEPIPLGTLDASDSEAQLVVEGVGTGAFVLEAYDGGGETLASLRGVLLEFEHESGEGLSMKLRGGLADDPDWCSGELGLTVAFEPDGSLPTSPDPIAVWNADAEEESTGTRLIVIHVHASDESQCEARWTLTLSGHPCDHGNTCF